jgi:hypothetical protein
MNLAEQNPMLQAQIIQQAVAEFTLKQQVKAVDTQQLRVEYRV